MHDTDALGACLFLVGSIGWHSDFRAGTSPRGSELFKVLPNYLEAMTRMRWSDITEVQQMKIVMSFLFSVLEL